MLSDRTKSKVSRARLRPIRFMVLDVDGVLTDGRIIYNERGTEYRVFDVHDGFGIRRSLKQGLQFAIISGKESKVVVHRARVLGIQELHQGVTDKLKVMKSLMKRYRLAAQEVCCMGDDEPDLPMLMEAGFSAAPRTAVQIVRKNVDYVTRAAGGRGAVREVLDLILKHKAPERN